MLRKPQFLVWTDDFIVAENLNCIARMRGQSCAASHFPTSSEPKAKTASREGEPMLDAHTKVSRFAVAIHLQNRVVLFEIPTV
jgi:DNA-binding phage protein